MMAIIPFVYLPQKITIPDLAFGFEYKTEQSIYADISGRENTSSIGRGSPSLTSGGILDTQCLGNLNADGCLSIPYGDDIKFNTTHTIAILFKLDFPLGITNNINTILSKDQYGTNQREFAIVIGKDIFGFSGFIFWCHWGGGTTLSSPDKVIFSSFSSDWHLIIAKYTNNQFLVKLDNVQIISGTFTPSTFNTPLFIGDRRIDNSSFAAYPNYAKIQYVYRWNAFLSDEQDNYLWNNGNFKFLSG